MIAVVVAATSHTVVTRWPGLAWCGTRVHTIPDALATSIAATRSTICSCSSTSTSPALWHRPGSSSTASGGSRGLPGGSVGTETLTGVLEATVRDPPDRAPAPD